MATLNNKSAGQSLTLLARSPKEKIHWAVKLLLSKGHKLGSLTMTNEGPRFEIDDRLMAPPEVYRLVGQYPEWNDRLGLGTAKIPPVSNKSR
jgi:hypothetical protein